MKALERVLEGLRPLVGKNGWDYGVVWKLADYSTRLRFIEMVGCCCWGGKEIQVNAEEEKMVQLCKDIVFPHPKTTKACDALSNLPNSIPLSFGIHMEVLISGQPRWFCSDEMNGTRVLIPVTGALIELFAAKHVPMDHQVIELIMVQCNEKQEGRTASTDENLKELVGKCTYNVAYSHNENKNLTLECLLDNHCFLEGSLTNPIPLLNPLSIVSSLTCAPQTTSLDHSQLVESLVTTPPECINVGRQKKRMVSICDSKKRGGNFQKSRNLLIERNRRTKLKSKILTLRSLVPIITKMDIQATLGDASTYIEELKKKITTLQDEIKDMKEDDASENKELENQNIGGKRKIEDYVSNHSSPSEISTDHSKHGHDSLIFNDLAHDVEEQVEVSECGGKEFLLKLIFEKRRGWFWRLMLSMNTLGLNVTDANVITVDGKVMNILKAEAKSEVIEVEEIKNSMLKLIQTGLVINNE